MITFENDAEIEQLFQKQFEIYESIVDWNNVSEETLAILKQLRLNIQKLMDAHDVVWKEDH